MVYENNEYILYFKNYLYSFRVTYFSVGLTYNSTIVTFYFL